MGLWEFLFGTTAEQRQEAERKRVKALVAQKRNERQRPKPLPDQVARDLNAIERGRNGGGWW